MEIEKRRRKQDDPRYKLFKGAVYLLAIILTIGLTTWANIKTETRGAFSDEVQMVFKSYCDVSNETQRKIWIRVIQLEIPAWPNDGVCGMIGDKEVTKITVTGDNDVVK